MVPKTASLKSDVMGCRLFTTLSLTGSDRLDCETNKRAPGTPQKSTVTGASVSISSPALGFSNDPRADHEPLVLSKLRSLVVAQTAVFVLLLSSWDGSWPKGQLSAAALGLVLQVHANASVCTPSSEDPAPSRPLNQNDENPKRRKRKMVVSWPSPIPLSCWTK
ncbi:hypothetical protein MRS44_001259 [Fusarium solani]|uniref:uncharacterized protein n=1 Tax=Fusarium solani TaxID=169388 RepID=UPI0032C428ED|nr:hypothetical protein MRS44_001259 [Fusarium solani]